MSYWYISPTNTPTTSLNRLHFIAVDNMLPGDKNHEFPVFHFNFFIYRNKFCRIAPASYEIQRYPISPLQEIRQLQPNKKKLFFLQMPTLAINIMEGWFWLSFCWKGRGVVGGVLINESPWKFNEYFKQSSEDIFKLDITKTLNIEGKKKLKCRMGEIFQ